MSHIAFDMQLEEAVLDLSKILEYDDIRDRLKGLHEYSVLYVKYVQVYKKLEECYDQIVHAQKRIDLRKIVESCIGRILELRHWMVSLNNGSDCIDFYPALKELQLGLEALDIPHPRFMVDDNASALETRRRLLVDALDKIKNKLNATNDTQHIMSEEMALEIIQTNERGRQSRQKIAELIKIRKNQEQELQHKHSGQEALSVDAAVRKIQSLARGFLVRCHVKHSAADELMLIGMDKQGHDPKDIKIYQKLKENMERRKDIQALNRINYDEAFVFAKEKLKELEGQEMREIIQEEINAWLLHNGDIAFPGPDEGGSMYILNPPPRMDFIEEGKEKSKDAKGTTKKHAAMIKRISVPNDEDEAPTCPKFFHHQFMKCIEVFNKNWHDKDHFANLSQKYDPEVLKAFLQPVIFEEVRVEVDTDTRVILKKLQKKLLAEGKAMNQKDQKKEMKRGAEDSVKFVVLDMGNKSAKKLPKDKTAQRSLESIFNELVENEIVQLCPNKSFEEYVGCDAVRAASAEVLDPSMAQVRRLVLELCVLPLASDFIHTNSPFVKSVLLYGGPANGKTLLVHAACTAAGATFINLSPRNTDGKYGGSQAGKMVQMAFKLAKIMAPAIIYIDEAELLFVRDKKKLRASGLKDKSSRIKKALLKEVAALQPGNRVLVLGTSSEPQAAPSKPPNLVSLFAKRIYVPYPDYTSRLVLWRTFLHIHGVVLPYDFNLSILAHIAVDYSPGSIEYVCKSVLTKKRLRNLHSHPLSSEELIHHLCDVTPLDKATLETLQKWDKKDIKTENDTKGAKALSPGKK